jgi:hypothetical protein
MDLSGSAPNVAMGAAGPLRIDWLAAHLRSCMPPTCQKPVDAQRSASASVSTCSAGTQRTAGVAASPTHTRAPRRLTATHRPSFVINGVLAQRIRSCALAPSDSPPLGWTSAFGSFHAAPHAFRSYTSNSETTHSPSPYNAVTVASIAGNCLACRTGPMLPVDAHRIIGWFDQLIWGVASRGRRRSTPAPAGRAATRWRDASSPPPRGCMPWRASSDFADAELCQQTSFGRAEADAVDPATGD